MAPVSQTPDGWTSLLQNVSVTVAAMYTELLGSQGVVVAKRDDPSHTRLYGLGGFPQEILVRTGDEERARDILDEWSKAAPVQGEPHDQ